MKVTEIVWLRKYDGEFIQVEILELLKQGDKSCARVKWISHEDWEEIGIVTRDRLLTYKPGVCKTEIKGVTQTWPPDDGIRDMTEKEFHDRVWRMSGQVPCKSCGLLGYQHPRESRLYGDVSTVRRLCNGWLGKF